MKSLHPLFKSVFQVLFLLCTFLFSASIVPNTLAAAQDSDITTLRVTLLDENDAPIVDAEINLILIRYSDVGVEQTPTATCRTDENGQCTFEVVDAPRLASGHAEAYLDVTGSARQLVGWSGNELDVTLKSGELVLAATISAPLETGYDYTPDANEVSTTATESPTDTPSVTPTALPTRTPTLTAQPTETPSPTASETPLPPTPAVKSGRVGILPVACGLIAFVIFAVLIWRNHRSMMDKG